MGKPTCVIIHPIMTPGMIHVFSIFLIVHFIWRLYCQSSYFLVTVGVGTFVFCPTSASTVLSIVMIIQLLRLVGAYMHMAQPRVANGSIRSPLSKGD